MCFSACGKPQNNWLRNAIKWHNPVLFDKRLANRVLRHFNEKAVIFAAAQWTVTRDCWVKCMSLSAFAWWCFIDVLLIILVWIGSLSLKRTGCQNSEENMTRHFTKEHHLLWTDYITVREMEVGKKRKKDKPSMTLKESLQQMKEIDLDIHKLRVKNFVI